MKQVPDRKKLRWAFLLKKCWAIVLESFGLLVAAPMIVLALISGFGTLCLAAWCIYALICRDGFFGSLFLTLVGVGITFASGWAAHLGGVVMQRGTIAGQIPVVPRVTPDNLPAEEILVRGSEEPSVARSEVLLRAAQRGQETPKEELLRVSPE